MNYVTRSAGGPGSAKTRGVRLAYILALVGVSACTRTPPTAAPTTKPAPAPPASVSHRALGMNVAPVREWGSNFPFINLVKQARPWVVHKQGAPWGQGGSVEMNAQGWIQSLQPGQSAELLLTIERHHVPNRRYVVRYQGQGKLSYKSRVDIVQQTPGRDVIELQKQAPGEVYFFSLTLEQTNPKDPLRQIEVIPEDLEAAYDAGERFNPEWLAVLRPFRALRFMDWMSTNNSGEQNWEDRPRIDALTYVWGVPVELMVELANLLDVDPWFTIPHRANDEYVEKFIQVVNEKLEPGRVAWFEHSNEVWNFGFGQAHYASGQGRLLWRSQKVLADAVGELERGSPKLNLDEMRKHHVEIDLGVVDEDLKKAKLTERFNKAAKNKDKAKEHLLARMAAAGPGNAYLQWHGKKTAELCARVHKVFEKGRVRCVLATQTSWRGIEEAILSCPEYKNAPCGKQVDAYAIATYFDGGLDAPENVEKVQAMIKKGEAGVAEAFVLLNGAPAEKPGLVDRALKKLGKSDAPQYRTLTQLESDIRYHGNAARQHGLQLVGYEGGSHVTPDRSARWAKDPEGVAFFRAVNRHPKMKDAYLRMLSAWREQGGSLWMHYLDVQPSSRHGSWGSLEALNEKAPKYNALLEFGRPGCWWEGCKRI